jgi:hypothetical protein
MNTSTIRPEGQKNAREWLFTEEQSEGENEWKGAESALFSSENAERSAEREEVGQKRSKIDRKMTRNSTNNDRMWFSILECAIKPMG